MQHGEMFATRPPPASTLTHHGHHAILNPVYWGKHSEEFLVGHVTELAIQIERLVDIALAARERAYCPYSNYRVGAALITESGRVFDGANVENSSYGLSICAERVAIHSAIAAGERVIVALAVATESGSTPCGACRQVAQEFAGELRVFLINSQGAYRETALGLLLPMPFAKSELELPTE